MKKIPLDWKNINTVFLDMDGTLLDLHFDNHFWFEHMPMRYAEKHGISVEKAGKELAGKTAKIEGSLDWYCLDYWEENLQMDIVGLKHEVADRISIRNNVTEFLEHLHSMEKRVVLLTNAHHKTVTLKFGYVNLEQYFDHIITSHDIGLAKEEEGFWDKLHEVEKFTTENCLFIDDNLDVLGVAKGHGIKNLLAIEKPDSQQAIKDTKAFTAIECYTQLMEN